MNTSASKIHTAELLSLLPHRSPMLLIDEVVSVSDTESRANLMIDSRSAFFVANSGVPAWIGIEYMGQTAALIAGFQLKAGIIAPHVGLLLGTRKYHSDIEWFTPSQRLQIRCQQAAAMQNTLATFQCAIHDRSLPIETAPLATAAVTVYRRPLEAAGVPEQAT